MHLLFVKEHWTLERLQRQLISTSFILWDNLVPTGETGETVMKRVESAWNMTVHIGETMVKQVESAWNRLNQRVETLMKNVKLGWISNETICFVVKKHRETCWVRMKHFVSWSWITLNQDESQWNNVFHGHKTRCFMTMIHFEYFSWCFVVFEGVSLLCFGLFRGVLRCFIALFHAVSRCLTAQFHDVSMCFMTIKHVQWKRALINFSCFAIGPQWPFLEASFFCNEFASPQLGPSNFSRTVVSPGRNFQG